MTVDVAEQRGFIGLALRGQTLSEQTAFVGMLPGQRAVVSEQAAYVALIPNGLVKRRRIVTVATGYRPA